VSGQCVDVRAERDDHRRMADDELRDVDAREAARMRRRDHDADAEARDLLRPGMGKVFKQIQDAQVKAAREPAKRARGKRA